MAFIKVKDLYDRHFEYRLLFTRIIELLAYDLRLSLLVMAFLLWLEECNEELTILNLAVQPIENVTWAIMETQCCIDYLVSDQSIVNPNIGFTFYEYFSKNISMQSLCQLKYTTISGIKRQLRTHCTRLFSDIIYQNIYGCSNPSPYQVLHVPGFPDPVFGKISFAYLPKSHMFDTTELIWSRHAQLVDEDDRSLYVTFSRGFPLSENEVREAFATRFGDCVEMVDMAPPINLQILFARVVMRNVETIDYVLGGSSTAKLNVKFKYLWAKKYRRNNN